jgi:hypothetical protein
MFDMIRSQNPEIEPDDGSQYLNESGEGIEEEPIDEGHTNNDGEGNVLQLTKSGEVYILTNLSSFSPPDRANLLQG